MSAISSSYLMSMENSRDIEDYLQSMLDLSNPQHMRFVEDLLQKLGHSHSHSKPAPVKNISMTMAKESSGTISKPAPATKQGQKGKAKQINLFSAEGKALENITLPGQHRLSSVQINSCLFNMISYL